MTKTKKSILTILALIGLALSIELCVVYYNANFVTDAKPSICAINDMVDCDGVAKTAYSQFLGIPLSWWGIFLYLIFLFLTFVDKLSEIKFLGFLKVFKNPSSYIFCIGLFSFCMSMILGGISVFKINTICIFCFMTYLMNLLIAITAKTRGISIVDEFKTAINDFIDAIKVKRYAFWFILLCLLGISIVTYTTVSNKFSPQVVLQKNLKSGFNTKNIKTDRNTMGPDNATLVINEYMDFNCGGCFIAQVYLHSIMAQFGNIKLIQHNIPLDSECNPTVKDGGGHKNSCLKARYAIAAGRQNKYWQIGQALFDVEVKNEKEIIEAARLLDIDVKKLKEDANSEEVKKELQDSIKEATEKGIVGTPTIFVGFKQLLGVGTYPEFVKVIQEQGGEFKSQNAK